jgi:hypothetical protein
MPIEDLLSELERTYLDSTFWRDIKVAILQQGGELSGPEMQHLELYIKAIKQEVVEQWRGSSLATAKARKAVEQAFLGQIQSLDLEMLQPILRKVGKAPPLSAKLNPHQAASLWLGFCRDQSFSAGCGLWQMYLDLLSEGVFSATELQTVIPPIIKDVFSRREIDEGNLLFIEEMIAKAEADTGLVFSGERYEDATKVMAWVVETAEALPPRRGRKKKPLDLAVDLGGIQRDSNAVNSVNQDLKDNATIFL